MRRIAIKACFALTAYALVAWAPVPNVVPSAFAKVDSDVQITEEQIAGKSFCVSRQVIHARPEHVWQVLSDYSNASRVFPMMKKCQLLEDHGDSKILLHRVAPSGPAGTFEYTLQVKENAPKTMEWHRISGDFKEVDGYWKLEPLDGGHSTLVTYSSHVNGGLFIPQMLIKRQARLDMPVVMESLKRHSETNQIAGRPTASHAQ